MGEGAETERAKTVITLLVMANVKQSRKSEALEKTCKNNNMRAQCKGEEHEKGGRGWHLKHAGDGAGSTP